MKNKSGLLAATFGVGLVFLGRNGLLNGWNLLTARGYVIPAESSVFRFRPTVMNQGSGEWWVYGEDANYYYHFTGDEHASYAKFPRGQAASCKGFDPTNHLTWCGG